MRPVQPLGNFRFVHVGPNSARVELLHRFYAEQHSEHLYPRTQTELSDIAKDGAVFAVEHADAIVAACYVKWEHEESRVREFGGICVGAAYKGQGLAGALGCLAIGQSLVVADAESLKAHVHVHNEAPNGLLSKLGFTRTGEIITLPADKVRPPMKATESDGSVTGYVWDFDFGACRSIAHRLREFPPKIADCSVMCDLGASTAPWRAHLMDIANELDSIAL